MSHWSRKTTGHLACLACLGSPLLDHQVPDQSICWPQGYSETPVLVNLGHRLLEMKLAKSTQALSSNQ